MITACVNTTPAPQGPCPGCGRCRDCGLPTFIPAPFPDLLFWRVPVGNEPSFTWRVPVGNEPSITC